MKATAATAPRLRILVTFGSRRGGTAEIAGAIADTLRDEGHRVRCMRADEVYEVSDYDAVVVGGALYAARWAREARRFVVRNAPALRARRVWMFSSGPLDDSATNEVVRPTRGVAALMARVAARGHATFGGRLASDAKGFPASAMAKTHAGDWRNWEQVKDWAREIARALAVAPQPAFVPAPRPARWLLAALCLATAFTAIAGGIALAARPDGSLVHLPTTVLAHAPFSTFLVPGLLLLAIGLGHAIAGWLVLRDRLYANAFAFAAGAALLVWIATEMVMLRTASALQLVYFATAVVIISEALRRRASDRAAVAALLVQT